MSDKNPYVCTLDEATQKKALEELNEDPKNRQGAIDTFRTWVLQQKHFKCPTDDKFLLCFLRVRYFSQLEARKLLENFLRKRAKIPEWFKDTDIGSPEVLEFLDTGACLVLPGRDPEGRKVFVFRPGHAHYGKKPFDKNLAFRTFAAIMDYIYLCDETTNVHGTVTVVDLSKSTLAHETIVPIADRKKMMQMWQNAYPARIKAFYLYNAGALIEIMMAFVKLAMEDKLQKRVKTFSSTESLFKHIPRSMFPDEYQDDDYDGPSAGSEKSIIDHMKKEFSRPEIRDRIKYISSKEFTIDMKEKDTDVPQASFRQLSVD